MHALPLTSVHRVHSVHWKLMEWLWLETNQKILRFMSCDWQNRSGSVTSNKHTTFLWMKLIIRVFREGIGWQVPIFQDDNYALTMDSTNLLSCQMVVPFGNYHRFKTTFLMLLKWQNFWQLNVCKFHSFLYQIWGMGNGRWRWGKLRRFFLRFSLALALLATPYNTMYTPVLPKDCDKSCWSLLEINND